MGSGSVAAQHSNQEPMSDLLGDLVDLDSKPVQGSSAVQASLVPGLDLLGECSHIDCCLHNLGAPLETRRPSVRAGGLDSPGQGQVLQPSAVAVPPESMRTSAPALSTILAAEQGKGLAILGQLSRRAGAIAYRLEFENTTTTTLDGFMIQMNKNAFGLEPVSQAVAVQQGAHALPGRHPSPLTLAWQLISLASRWPQSHLGRGPPWQCPCSRAQLWCLLGAPRQPSK